MIYFYARIAEILVVVGFARRRVPDYASSCRDVPELFKVGPVPHEFTFYHLPFTSSTTLCVRLVPCTFRLLS